MNDLLNMAITAHGGWERWQRTKRITVEATIEGAVWAAKGKGGLFDDVRITIDPHRPHSEYAPFRVAGHHSVWEPERTAIETDRGEVVDERRNPRASFDGHARETQWDDQHVIYFSGYAIWTYLTTPYLFRLPGFESEEIEPWIENGEKWRRLSVRFPASVPSHSTEQLFYFDGDGMLRRHDYTADIIGRAPSANYATDAKAFDGLVIPTKRRVYARRPDNSADFERVAVAIDIHDVEVE